MHALRSVPLARRLVRLALVVASLGISAAAAAQALPVAAIGGAPVPLEVPRRPTLTMTLAAPSEVQIDAMGQGMDAQLHLFQNDQLVTQDGDSGEGTDARIVTFLPAGTFDVRISEWRGRPMSARVQAQILPPMTPAATIAPGAPPTPVSTPAGSSARAASAEVTLVVASAGTYRIDAVAEGRDAELVLIRDAAIVAQDSDSGEGVNASLTRALTPGSYTLRVRDFVNRASTITLTVAPQ